MTQSPSPAINVGFWLRWIAANALGMAGGQVVGGMLGLLVGGLVVQAGETLGLLVIYALLGFTTGAFIGLLQRMFVAQEIDLPREWVWRSAIGWGIGYVTATLNASVMRLTLGDFLSTVVSWALLGVMVGATQYAILRREVERAGWWIVINLAGWVLSQPIAAIGLGAAVSLGVQADDSTAALIAIVLIGAAAGAFTGLGLMWLLRRRLQPGVAG